MVAIDLLPDSDVLTLFEQIIERTVTCSNDHEEGDDGHGSNVRGQILICIHAHDGRNNACAHCGPVHFPDFPANEIVLRTIAILEIPDNRLLFAYELSNALLVIYDRIRILSVRPKDNIDDEIDIWIYAIERARSYNEFFDKRWIAILELKKLVKNIFETTDIVLQNERKALFLEAFRKEKIEVTNFRIRILKMIQDHMTTSTEL